MALRDDINERARALVGRVLKGKWRLERVVGVGGMATVYSAVHRNQSRVAIKMLHPEIALDSEVTSRFLREGYMANAVGHPGTVAVLDDDVTEEGVPFLVMELLQGETARSALVAKRREAADLGSVAGGRSATRSARGGARLRRGPPRSQAREPVSHQRLAGSRCSTSGSLACAKSPTPAARPRASGSLLGTPAFMAPEQARGRWDEVDGATDLWAVGATLFTLLTGRLVHEAETLQSSWCSRPPPRRRRSRGGSPSSHRRWSKSSIGRLPSKSRRAGRMLGRCAPG
jgi:serine/threonine-protein kinase